MTGRESPERIPPEDVARTVRLLLQSGYLEREHTAAVIHDLRRLRQRLRQLCALMPEALHAIAVKANPLVEILRVIVEEGCGLEAASAGEVAVARAAGCPADKLLFDSPCKTRGELELVHEGPDLNANCLEELARLAEVVEREPPAGRVGLRVNPEVGAGGIAALSVATATSKFGALLEAERDAIIEAYRRYPWLNMIHCHVGSQAMPLGTMIEGVRRTVAFADEMNALLGREQIHTIDIGGGVPAQYRATEPESDLEGYVSALRQDVPALFREGRQVVTELGRSVQSACGLAVSRVEYVLDRGGQRVAVIHFGADLMVRRAYVPEQWWNDVLVLDANGHIRQDEPVPTTIAGPLCFAGDKLYTNEMLPRIEPGDLVVVRDIGAYVLAMVSRYNSREIPAVVGVDEGDELRLLRRRESVDDVVRFWSLD